MADLACKKKINEIKVWASTEAKPSNEIQIHKTKNDFKFNFTLKSGCLQLVRPVREFFFGFLMYLLFVLHQLTWFWSASLQICFQYYISVLKLVAASRLTWRWQCLQKLLPECGQRPQEVALILRWGFQNESKDRQWHLPKLDPTIKLRQTEKLNMQKHHNCQQLKN